MSDVTKSNVAPEGELTDEQLKKVTGGLHDFHITKTIDSPSPTPILATSPAPPPPPPKKG